MVRSLLRTTANSRAWVVAADGKVEAVLGTMEDVRLRVVPISEVETPALKAVRPSRSRVEYYWTLTPFLPSFILDMNPTAQTAVYVDADMYFLRSADLILEEFVADEVAATMITPHDYLPKYDQSSTSGVYCVQFMPFRRASSSAILSDWQEQCLQWCFQRVEHGRFGDQKYLDLWPEKFRSAVHLQKFVHLLGAPWNAGQRSPESLVGYHFHGLRRIMGQYVALHPGYRVPHQIRERVYAPYLEDLAESLKIVATVQGPTLLQPRISLSVARRILSDAVSDGFHASPIGRIPNALPVDF